MQEVITLNHVPKEDIKRTNLPKFHKHKLILSVIYEET